MIKWIDVKKELPDSNVPVLICSDSGDIMVAVLYNTALLGYWWREYKHEQKIIKKVTHWAHINAPESEGDDE